MIKKRLLDKKKLFFKIKILKIIEIQLKLKLLNEIGSKEEKRLFIILNL